MLASVCCCAATESRNGGGGGGVNGERTQRQRVAQNVCNVYVLALRERTANTVRKCEEV